jgi:hypothetical protein
MTLLRHAKKVWRVNPLFHVRRPLCSIVCSYSGGRYMYQRHICVRFFFPSFVQLPAFDASSQLNVKLVILFQHHYLCIGTTLGLIHHSRCPTLPPMWKFVLVQVTLRPPSLDQFPERNLRVPKTRSARGPPRLPLALTV